MEILNQFGFDIKLFAAQIVNFLVIAFVFKRFLYKPLLEILEKRKSTIKKGLLDAEKAQKALEEAEERKDAIISKAGIEADRIINEAKNQAESIREGMLEETKKEINAMMEATVTQIQLEKENFKKEAKNMSLEIAKQVLNSTLSSLFDNKEKEIIVKKSISKIKQHE
jgi:F-type H+-transporting ATPase subunit b